MQRRYSKMLRRVHDRIRTHPADPLSLDDLAEAAAMSRFHFHRIFAALTGETAAEAVRRIRFHIAALALATQTKPVAHIARDCGYPNPASFARAFRARFGQTPAEFRRAGADLPARLRIPFPKGGLPMFPVTILDAPARHLIGLPHRGAYHDISRTYEILGPELGAAGLWDKAKGMIAVYYDDPAAVPAADLTSFAAVAFADDVPCPPGLETLALPGGRHAVLHFTGPYAGLPAAYHWLYGDWLVASNASLRDAPSWEFYLNSPMDTSPADLRTDIYLPLA